MSVRNARCNDKDCELYSLYKEPNIVEDIKIRRLGWAGRVVRMKEEGIRKKVF